MASNGSNMLHKVCVCIPVRNGAKTIKATLKSLINQNYQNIEIIVCDNNSTDNTVSIIENFALDNNTVPITYLRNPIDGTAEQNWNYLLRNIPKHYDYYALYHADDIYNPDLIGKQLTVIQESGVGAVFCTARLIDDTDCDISEELNHTGKLPLEVNESVFDYQTLLHYTLKHYNFVKAPSFFFSKKILEDGFIFNPQFKSSADLDMWFKIAEKYKIAIINEPLLLYRISKNQGTYLLSLGKETEADYFSVMDFHINKVHVDNNVLGWYRSYRGMNMITRAVNLCKKDKSSEALSLLRQAVKMKNLPYLFQISHGVRNFLLGVALRIVIPFHLEKKLIDFIKR